MSANPNGTRMPRAERHEQVRRLKDEKGLTFREIAARLGLAKSTVTSVYYDPTGEGDRQRKRKYERPCIDCGVAINPNGIRSEIVRCISCDGARKREESRQWIVESIHEWAQMFGAPPSAIDWNPAQARSRRYCAWKADRYEATGRPWPCTALVQNNFGSWNNGLRAAGFEPLTPQQYPVGHAGVALMREDAA